MAVDTPLVVVLGAGVIGLQAAIELLKQGFRVAIVARDWPGDQNPAYTSPWAGAQWRSTSKMHETHMQNWERRTFQHWLQLTVDLPASQTGISTKPGIYYWDSHASAGKKAEEWIWWMPFLPKLRMLDRSEIPVPKEGLEGVSYQSFNIAPEKYLKFLQSQCKALGAKFVDTSVDSFEAIFGLEGLEHARGIVNCAGLACKSLVDDADLYPTKGQAVVVKGEARRISTGLGRDWEAVVVPREGLDETFLGVSKIYGDGSLTTDDATTNMILEQAKPLAPELLNADGEFTVLRVQVGVRPTRTGGARVELVDLPNVPNRWVCHNYGHHGAGYEESFGCAETVVGLVSQKLNRS